MLERKVGRDISDADWDLFMRCYATTYAAHYSTPYLNRRFFLQIARSMPETLLMVARVARSADRHRACTVRSRASLRALLGSNRVRSLPAF